MLRLGIDVGGTKAAFAVVDAAGRIRRQARIATPPLLESGQPFLDRVAAEAAALIAAEPAIAAIGLGLCELVGLAGAVESGHRVAWAGLPVAERLAEATGRPVRIEADIRAAALAEALLGAGRNLPVHLHVNIGTGLSAVLMQQGVPHRGAHGHALVLATGLSAVLCPACGQISEQSLEDLASGGGIALRAQRIPQAQALREGALALGSTLAMLAGLLDPDGIVVGGGLGAAPGPFWEDLVKETRRRIWSPRTRGLALVQASLGGEAGVIGAALAAEAA